MIRRNLLAIVCVGFSGALVAVVALVVFNFVQLANAQVFVQDLVGRAVDEGSAMMLPEIAPAAISTLPPNTLTHLLDRAHRVGPLVSMRKADCAVQTGAANLCAGQLLACIVEGEGQAGDFTANVAMCRGGNLAPYRLAGLRWMSRITDERSSDVEDRSHI